MAGKEQRWGRDRRHKVSRTRSGNDSHLVAMWPEPLPKAHAIFRIMGSGVPFRAWRPLVSSRA
jgi:hypothetical protein